MTELRFGGSQQAEAMAWQRAIVVFAESYALAANGGPLKADGWIGYDDAAAAAEYRRRRGLPSPPPGVVVTHEEYGALVKTAPPPPPAVHTALTFRGTGGIIGADYTSRLAHMTGSREVPILYPAAMGGIPVGAANDIGAPSGQKCVDIALELACQEIERSSYTFHLFGYSLGAIAASKVRAALLPGGRLADHAHRYVCAVMLGNPARAFGHTFYLGAIPAGFGMADWHLPQEACTWDWLECIDPGDLYGNAPGGEIGEVLRAAYRMVMDIQASDLLGTTVVLVRNVLKLLDEAGVQLPLDIPGIITGALAGLLLAFLPTEFAKYLQIGDRETAAAVQAAILALRFFADQPPTACHISYEFRHAIPGVTYLDLAAQHVRHWAAVKSVAA